MIQHNQPIRFVGGQWPLFPQRKTPRDDMVCSTSRRHSNRRRVPPPRSNGMVSCSARKTKSGPNPSAYERRMAAEAEAGNQPTRIGHGRTRTAKMLMIL